MEKVYYDLRSNEFLKEIEKGILPPECYFTYVCGPDDGIVIEHYKINDKQLDYSYSVEHRNSISRKRENEERFAFFSEHIPNYEYGYIPHLLHITIPKSVFEEYCKKAN